MNLEINILKTKVIPMVSIVYVKYVETMKDAPTFVVGGTQKLGESATCRTKCCSSSMARLVAQYDRPGATGQQNQYFRYRQGNRPRR
mmetsp:Transcript_14812/g.17363  ORF Transcript_14812/g.17363 Transcript_14812/m.17363 type:complete len:87 (+) Transcript_14812:294-554(+)